MNHSVMIRSNDDNGNKTTSKKKKTTALIILDGWGYREDTAHNAIAAGHTPVLDNLWKNAPHTLIQASASFVGLPEGQMGNSEVGHMNIGAGRIVYQDLTRIDKAIEDGSFNSNDALDSAVNDALKNDSALHLMGLLSAGGVHSHIDHIMAMIDMAYAKGLRKIYVHAFLDGRDSPPRSAASSLKAIDERLHALGAGYIASIIGRYFAMDRDQRWDRIEKAYNLLVSGECVHTATNALSGLQAAYARGENDEFVEATLIVPEGRKPLQMKKNDAVIFMNFRADRARQLTRAFTEKDFSGFQRNVCPALSRFVMLTRYANNIKAHCAFPPESVKNSLGEIMALEGKTQLRLAETEKYAHVTFFFNGGREEPFKGEERHMIQSPEVATYDIQPEMSAPEVTDHFVDAIASGTYDLIVCNFANSDMVGHTGNYSAAVKAVEAVDTSLGKILEALNKNNGQCLITADHGNAELMMNEETGQPHTAHTCEPVPLIYSGSQSLALRGNGRLCDLAPTVLALMGIEQPKEMTGQNLVIQP